MTKNQDIRTLIVSVESRKGGVGKTTAALCLARLLCKKGYAVLVLDLDVTGTDAANIAKSPFWEKDLHVIQETDSNGASKDSLNLIKLFDQCFMAGKTIPDFAVQDAMPGTLLIDLRKVNVLGSQIYRTEKGDGNRKDTTCIERPGILFDDLHSLWLLELVKQVADNFARIVSSDQSVRPAIILDSSPGYVGIAPSVHEWLTDRGPQDGKFLMVTSLDTQDLHACEQAVNVIHDLYVDKWDTSRLFTGKKDKETVFEVRKDQEAFFMRLASSTGERIGKVDPLAFYRSTALSSSQQHDEKGQRFCDHPADYIAAIINRVPSAVKAGHLVYEYPFIVGKNGGTFNHVFGGIDDNGERQGWRKRMISYDEYIENQFLLPWLQRGHRYRDRNVRHLIDILEMAEDELRNVAHLDNSNEPIQLITIDFKNYNMLWDQLGKANDIVSRARAAVENAGLGHLARLIHDEWLPGSIVSGFRNMLLRMLRDSDFPVFEIKPFDFEPAGMIRPETRQFMTELKKRILSELHDTETIKLETKGMKIADVLSGVLAGLVSLSLASTAWHSPLKKELSGLFAGVLLIELRHWAKKGEEKPRKFGLQRFLAQESVSQTELRKDMEMHDSLRFFRRHVMREDETYIADFYKACTTAQARLIDFLADSRFLIRLLRFIVTGEMKRGDLFPFVRGIAEDVIVKKTLSHEDAPHKMAKAVQAAEYFREFDSVLNEILKVWGVANE